jgi:hypothetical protein
MNQWSGKHREAVVQMPWLTKIDTNNIIEEYDDVRKFFSSNKELSQDEVYTTLNNILLDPMDLCRPSKHVAERGYKELFFLEFKELLCTNNKKYNELRKDIDSNLGKSATVTISMISAVLSDRIGVEVGAVVGLCAILLFSAVKLGIESFCRFQAQHS